MSQLRKDPLSDQWVIIAEGRENRPNEFERVPLRRVATRCPFCAGHEEDTPPPLAVYENGNGRLTRDPWLVRVVPNKYPAMLSSGRTSAVANGPYLQCDAVGAHEVIIETPRHVASLSQLTEDEARLLLLAYRDRLVALQRNRDYAYALVFKNVGPEAGASLEHSHSQIMATPMVPVQIEREIASAQRLHADNRRCFFCEMIEHELSEDERVVATSEQFIAICPFASRMPYEIWVLPRRHASHFECQPDEQLAELAQFVQKAVAKLESVHQTPAYNFFLHTAPFDTSPLRHYHWHIEIFPRLTITAGFEWGTGYYINPVPPEQAAAILRT
jgi:UDPglucose--hexose-1-phosphate uridylyltransferase